jgi:hypothetical protein
MTSTTETLAELLRQDDDSRELRAYRRIRSDGDRFAVAYRLPDDRHFVVTVDLDSPVALSNIAPFGEPRLGRTYLTIVTDRQVNEALEQRQREDIGDELQCGGCGSYHGSAAAARRCCEDL